MKLRKVLSSIIAGAVAVSTMAVSASAITDYPDGYTLDLIAEGYAVTDVYGFTFNISGDIDSGVGGGVGFNSPSTGWESHEWGNADAGKELNGSDGKVTFTKDAPVFAETDVTDPENPYAQIWMQQWWGSDITIDSVEVLGADGVVLSVGAAEEAPAEDAATGAFTGNGVAGTPVCFKVTDDVTEVVAKIVCAEATDGFDGMNDWCGEGVVVTLEDGTKAYYQFGGAQVTWGWDATGDKVDECTDGVNGSTWLGTFADNAVELTIPVAKNAIVEIHTLSWEDFAGTQYTVTVDGGVEAYEAPAAEEETTEDDAAEEDDAALEGLTLADCYNAGTVVLVADDGSNAYVTSNGLDITDVYGYRVTAQFPMAEVTDDNVWIGGGIGTNSNSTGWASTEWGKESGRKPIVTNFDDQGVVTLELVSDASLFAADDAYAQLWIQAWGGTMTILKVEVLGADGVIDEVIVAEAEEVEAPAEDETVEEAPEVDEAPATGDVDAETDSSKGSPDTGVEDVAVVAGLAIVAAGAVLVSKKRK